MNHVNHYVLLRLSLLIILGIVLAACGSAIASGPIIEEQWAASAHGDAEARSFTRWDDEDPPEIPTHCAKCHSTPGYLDFLGEDGSTPGQVDHPAPTGTTIECEACHNETAENKDFVLMPSTLKIEGLSMDANCMECHQGRASALQVSEMIDGQPRDTVNTELSLPNIHNNPAGAIMYGAEAKGGAEYLNHFYTGHETYVQRFYHGFDTCYTCHSPHALDVDIQKCSACHLGADTIEGVRNIRLRKTDFDGDGDITEGLSGEIETMQDKLLATIMLYAAATEGAENIRYEGRFVNPTGDSYSTWTPKLLQAAYNYQFTDKDPGNYTHNASYIMQLLYDSIEDLGGGTRGMVRP